MGGFLGAALAVGALLIWRGWRSASGTGPSAAGRATAGDALTVTDGATTAAGVTASGVVASGIAMAGAAGTYASPPGVVASNGAASGLPGTGQAGPGQTGPGQTGPGQTGPGRASTPLRLRPVVALRDQLTASGVENVTPRQLMTSSIAAGLVVFVMFVGLTRTWPIAVAFGCFAGAAPLALVRYRARVRRRELRELWPDVVDNLASAVRAGLSLPEALAQVGARGPEPMRAPFDRFARDYRASGRFGACLDRLKERLADPTGDRIVESLRMARDVGGSDLGRVLRTLAAFLREDLRTRAELEARQGWTVNAARLAVAAPWLLLAIMSLRSSSVQAFNAPAGWMVLACGAGVCVVAYRLMVRIGRLPEEERVLR